MILIITNFKGNIRINHFHFEFTLSNRSIMYIYVLLDRCLVSRKELVRRQPSPRVCISFLYISSTPNLNNYAV